MVRTKTADREDAKRHAGKTPCIFDLLGTRFGMRWLAKECMDAGGSGKPGPTRGRARGSRGGDDEWLKFVRNDRRGRRRVLRTALSSSLDGTMD